MRLLKNKFEIIFVLLNFKLRKQLFITETPAMNQKYAIKNYSWNKNMQSEYFDERGR